MAPAEKMSTTLMDTGSVKTAQTKHGKADITKVYKDQKR